jgi:hypothetical protein
MSVPPGFAIEVRNDRDIVISKSEEGFEVTYRREMSYPMLVASDVLRNSFDDSTVGHLAQAWKIALNKAKELGWLNDRRKKRMPQSRT